MITTIRCSNWQRSFILSLVTWFSLSRRSKSWGKLKTARQNQWELKHRVLSGICSLIASSGFLETEVMGSIVRLLGGRHQVSGDLSENGIVTPEHHMPNFFWTTALAAFTVSSLVQPNNSSS